jgi:hypothetical protein
VTTYVITPGGRVPVVYTVRGSYGVEAYAVRADALAARSRQIAAGDAADDIQVVLEPPWCGDEEHYCGVNGTETDLVADVDGVWTPTPEWWARWATWGCCRRGGES